jgi:hypothetical protein
MSELILKFTIPEESSEAEMAFKAGDWYLAVGDIVTELRKRLKYGDAGKEMDEFNAWVWGMLEERGLDPWG